MPRFGFAQLLCFVLLSGAFLVFGSERSEADEGLASWYGPGFEGRKTASGEVYDPNGYTAAHKTLPFGTELIVSYGDRSVPVTVNDRGPFLGTRELDLSHAAARDLGLVPEGANYVEYEVVGSPGTEPSQQVAQPPVPSQAAAQQPGLPQGVAQQPTPSQGAVQQPEFAQGAAPQPNLTQQAAQQPAPLSQGAAQPTAQPILSRGTAQEQLVPLQGVAQEGPALTQEAAQLSQGTPQQPNPVQEAAQRSNPLRGATQQPGLVQGTTEDSRPPAQPGLSGNGAPQPPLTQGTTQQPNLSQGAAQQPDLSQGTAQQPTLSQGATQEPRITQGAAQQPATQGVVQQPGLTEADGGYREGYSDYPSSYPAAQDEANGGTYVVQPGDTLAQIGAQLGIPAADLARYNGITDPDVIYGGQPLYFLTLENGPVGAGSNPATNDAAIYNPLEAVNNTPIAGPEGAGNYVQTGRSDVAPSFTSENGELWVPYWTVTSGGVVFGGERRMLPATGGGYRGG